MSRFRVEEAESSEEDFSEFAEQVTIGSSAYILYGGTDVGHSAVVRAESERELCVEYDGRLEIVFRACIGHTVFPDETSARRHRMRGVEAAAKRRREWEEFVG